MPDYEHWTLESVAGVFMDIPTEFYRRFTAKYEIMKQEENGDVSYGKLIDKFLGVWLRKKVNSLPSP